MAHKKENSEEKINLKLLNWLNDTSLFNQNQGMQRLPLYIKQNLKHSLRDYQFSAIHNLDAVESLNKKDGLYNQLMFYMATGSGKTDIMAAIILYMYQVHDYQCFLFTTSTTAVVNKTIDNLTNTASPKYLYKDPLVIDGQRISIKAVSEFPIVLEKDSIYLKFTGVQQLSNDINFPRENGITKESLKKHKVVVLADEAHHFNVGTRSKSEDTTNKSWEALLDKIRDLNSANQQLEFTATIDLHNPAIYHKYQNKIIAQYDLSKFINDGYSKQVYRLQANNSDADKMLNAVLLSQYRKRIAQNMGIPDFKPVILFKSNTVKVSNETNEHFLSMINNLTAESLQDFVQSQNRSTQSEVLSLAYKYWLNQDFGETVAELKRDFQEFTTINANDSGKKNILDNESVAQKLNNLESPANPIRSVFAVAKLSEGWDVLNLYDIVRIGEKNIKPSDTNAEAQLIGRGARYNPFIYKGQKSYTRRFDDRKSEIQLLERLYYHTINNPQYLENLRKSLDAINLPVNEDTRYKIYTAKVKNSFKRTNTYKHGNVYYNKVEVIPEDHYDSIQKYGFDPDTTEPINMINATTERKIDMGADKDNSSLFPIVNVAVFGNPSDKALIRTAISFNPFYRFDSLKKQCPTLASVREFLTSDKWLGHAVVRARVANGHRLTHQEKLTAVEKYLLRVQNDLVNNFQRSKGTNQFEKVAINEVIKDYDKRVGNSFNDPKAAKIGPYPMKGKDWYSYDYAIVDQLEMDFIERIGAEIPTFKKKYDQIYLLRIDERNTEFKLHDFGESVYRYEGYMPDFIMYLKNEDYIYQIYMEPKGMAFVEKDRWKEELLERIDPKNVIILENNDDIKLFGVKFYVEDKSKKDLHHMFSELRDKEILPDN
ncbi:DEAD/DEAH box helicase family protein [Limosilactobacillus reuteri]|uniref:Restriction endonuclease subunit R n=1 Tax=Limosilactobacillus reuteri TaxID=1598 RepID=A0A256VP68_LIMRT|nr:DEAD/DEAH box helicase family protein [Limosilactobacillus reuteri]OYS61106.1 restriction endonuclease subunit R [Limosilactobacillus reuteri]OYS62511.1 restriction endonuclease subunit R [Limosilactobacillus reuteri]OYS66022.1 restriction endonuclease subunit R [Limosilactobacillus reuteri]OYS74143.1 restriction endonuclease subunit R [Limosilactobacillus reuteri]OYS76466.1 restriction endonuclease subunit R [Limosilactobacillus reuteri]